MSGFMDKAKKFREEHKDTFDKVEAKSRELAEQGKAKLEEARERFDEEQAKRRDDAPAGDPATTGAAGSDPAKPDVPADEGVATPTDKPGDTPPPVPPAGTVPPPPPPPPAAA